MAGSYRRLMNNLGKARAPTMSAEEAVADLLSLDRGFTVSEAPDFIEELAKRGYRLAANTDSSISKPTESKS